MHHYIILVMVIHIIGYGDSYYWWNYINDLWRSGTRKIFNGKGDHVWDSGDIITVKFDCDNWTIDWLQNNKSIGGPYQLDRKTKVFYPAIGLWLTSIYHNIC